jgi:hypothetical protein
MTAPPDPDRDSFLPDSDADALAGTLVRTLRARCSLVDAKESGGRY